MHKVLHHTSLSLLAIVALGAIVYSNTLNGPYQWDDGYYLEQNPFVNSDAGLESLRDNSALYHKVAERYIPFLTFAGNYRIHGFRSLGYHAVNLAIHLLNGLLVYALLRITVNTLNVRGRMPAAAGPYLPLFVALLFVAHPIQTEAVTYLSQRVGLLAAFFSLLSLTLYARWRTEHETVAGSVTRQRQPGETMRQAAVYGLSVLAAVAAMKSKESAFTLPFMIILYEYAFLPQGPKCRLRALLPFILTLAVIPLTMAFVVGKGTASGSLTETYGAHSVPEYLFTELRVLMTYLRLLVLPVGQNVDHEYALSHSFFEAPVMLSFLALSGLFILAVILFMRTRRTGGAGRLIAFGILWFFLTLAVESSILPLPRVIDEYRLYLPMIGPCLAVLAAVLWLLELPSLRPAARWVLPAFVVLLAAAGFAAHDRNELWNSTIDLWSDAAAKSPGKATVHVNLAAAYLRWGRTEESVREAEIALALDPQGIVRASAHTILGNNYSDLGWSGDAVREFRSALQAEPGYRPALMGLALEQANRGDHYPAMPPR